MDPIANMFTIIRNAQAVARSEVVLPFSKIKLAIAKILEQTGYIKKVSTEKNKFKEIKIELAYQTGRPKIRALNRISKPGRRVYVSTDQLPIVLNKKGLAIISTSHGLMTNKEAKKKKIGGEVVGEIY